MEGVKIPRLLNKLDIIGRIVGVKKYETVKEIHNTIQFVDDKSNVIGAKDIDSLTGYITDFVLVLKESCNHNWLLLNDKKTTFVRMGIPDTQKRKATLKLTVNQIDLYEDLLIKALGWWMTSDHSMLEHLNRTKGPILMKVNSLKSFNEYVIKRGM